MPEVVYDPHGDFEQLLSEFKELERKYKMEKNECLYLEIRVQTFVFQRFKVLFEIGSYFFNPVHKWIVSTIF